MAGVFNNGGDVTVSNQQPAAPSVVVGNTEGSGIFAGDAVASISTSTGTGTGGGIRLSDLSIGPEGAPITDGALAYDNTTGVFTYFPADLTGYLQGLPSDVTLYPAGLARATDVPNELVLVSQQLDLRRDSTVIDSVDLSSLSGGSGVAVQDNTTPEGMGGIATLNFGSNLDVTVTGTGAAQVATINSAGGGTNPIPQERFNISLSPSSLVQGSGATTVTATVSVNSPFVLTGFNSVGVHSASSTATPNPAMRTGLTGQSSTFDFSIDPTVAETWNISAQLTSTDAMGVAQPNHTVSRSLHVNSPWYADALTSAPTAISDLTSRGVYNSGVSYTFPAVSGGTAYIALPSSVTPHLPIWHRVLRNSCHFTDRFWSHFIYLIH